MYKLVVTELAHQDLDNIVSYITIQLANPAAASDFLDEVDKCYGYLKSKPMIYSKCNDSRLGKEGYRKAVIKNYVLIYKVDLEAICAGFGISLSQFFAEGNETVILNEGQRQMLDIWNTLNKEQKAALSELLEKM